VHSQYANSSFHCRRLFLFLHSFHNRLSPSVCDSRSMDFLMMAQARVFINIMQQQQQYQQQRQWQRRHWPIPQLFMFNLPSTTHESFASSPGLTTMLSEVDLMVAPSVCIKHKVRSRQQTHKKEANRKEKRHKRDSFKFIRIKSIKMFVSLTLHDNSYVDGSRALGI